MNEDFVDSWDETLKMRYERNEARNWAIFLYKTLYIWAPGVMQKDS